MVVDAGPGADFAESGRSPVFISYKRDAESDRTLAVFLHDALTRHGHNVFIDINIPPGADWSEMISSKIRSCDCFIVLLSEASASDQGFVLAETSIAQEAYSSTGRPNILPVRVAFTGNLPLRMSAAIGHLQHFEWHDQSDNDTLLPALLGAIAKAEGAGAKSSSLQRGDHFIVTGNLWQSAGLRESLAGTMIVPVNADQDVELAVTRTRGPGFFGARVRQCGDLEVAIWKGAAYRPVQSDPERSVTMLEGDSHGWRFSRYPTDAAVLLKRTDGRKDPIVVTFDRDVVRSVWKLSHQLGSQSESFLIVMKDSSAK